MTTKFIQITAVDQGHFFRVYAVDASGQVWTAINPEKWNKHDPARNLYVWEKVIGPEYQK